MASTKSAKEKTEVLVPEQGTEASSTVAEENTAVEESTVDINFYRCTEDCVYDHEWHAAGDILEIPDDVVVNHTKLVRIEDPSYYRNCEGMEVYDPKTDSRRKRARARVMDGILTRN